MSEEHQAGKARRGDSRESHPARAELERFMRGEMGPEESRAVVRHLLTGCPECRQTTGRLWDFGACLRSAIDDLRAAANYPAEPPAGEGGSAP